MAASTLRNKLGREPAGSENAIVARPLEMRQVWWRVGQGTGAPSTS